MFCTLVFCANLHAASQFSAPDSWRISAAIGFGEAEYPINQKSSESIYLIPSIAYYGEKFFIENLSVGYSLIEDEQIVFDIAGRMNLDGLYFYKDNPDVFSSLSINTQFFRIDPEPKPIERSLSYLVGPALTFAHDKMEFSARYFQDISGVHNGYEAEFSIYNYTELGQWTFAFEILSTFKDKKLINYYYQITQEELAVFHEDYKPNDSAHNWSVLFSLKRPLTDKLSYIANYKQTFLDQAINKSPTINKNNIAWYFMGIEYNL